MLVSECCNEAVTTVDIQEAMAFYECKKCSRPCEGRASLDLSAFDSQGETHEDDR